jgi:hypothetical protein
MNQTFNLHRFAMMLKLDIAEKGKTYLLMFSLLIFGVLLMMLPVTFAEGYNNMREVLHYFAVIMLLLFGGSLFTSSAFSQFSNPSTGISALMMPASRTEKFLSSFLINQLFVTAFLVIFWQIHYVTIDIANEKLVNPTPRYRHFHYSYFLYSIFGYYIIQAVVFLGSIYFKKASYAKTAGVFAVCAFLLACFNYMVAIRFTKPATSVTAFPLSGWKVWFLSENGRPSPYSNVFYDLALPHDVLLATQGFVALLVMMLWAAAFFQMKERQI